MLSAIQWPATGRAVYRRSGSSVLVTELEADGRHGLLRALRLGPSDDRGRHRRLVEEPGEGRLGAGHAPVLGDAGDRLADGAVALLAEGLPKASVALLPVVVFPSR